MKGHTFFSIFTIYAPLFLTKVAIMKMPTITICVRKVYEVIKISKIYLTSHKPETNTFSTCRTARVPTRVYISERQ